MPRGGARPGSGPKKGARYKKTTKASPVVAAVANLVAGPSAGTKFHDAHDFAMDVINDASASMDDKVRLAIAVMPYQRPKLAEVAANKKGAAADAAKSAGAGRFATPTGPKLVADNTK